MQNSKIKMKIQNAKWLFVLFAVMTIFMGAPMAMAAPEGGDNKVIPTAIPCPNNLPCITGATQRGEGGKNVRDTVIERFGGGFLKSFLGIVAVTCVIFLIVGGMQMHLAFGNEEQIKKAKTTIIWAIVGLVVSMLSVAIVQIISKLEF